MKESEIKKKELGMKDVVVCLLLTSFGFSQVFGERPSFLPDLPTKHNIIKPQNFPEDKKTNIEKGAKKNNAQNRIIELKVSEQNQIFEGRPSFLPNIPLKININKLQNLQDEEEIDVKKDARENDPVIDLKTDERQPIFPVLPLSVPSDNTVNSDLKKSKPITFVEQPEVDKKQQKFPDDVKVNVEEKKGISGDRNTRPDLKIELIFPVLPLSETVKSLANSEIKEKEPELDLDLQFPVLIPGIITVPSEALTRPLEMTVPSGSQSVPNPALDLGNSSSDVLIEASKVLGPNNSGVDVVRPSVAEPRTVPEKPKEVGEPYASAKHAKHWFKKGSKLSFNEPVIDCLRSDIFKQLSVKIYEVQELIAEPKVLVKPIFNVVPSLETEVTYREEKRKVIIMVPKEKDEERIVQSVIEVEELIIDEVSGVKKKVIRLVPMTSMVIAKCVELVPEEYETSVKIPVFTQKNSSITIQTFTGIMVTEPVKMTTMEMIKKKVEGAILTPKPKLDIPQAFSPQD